MGEVIGGFLPYALGVALSPIPIIAVIVMLLGRHARTLSVGFLGGWVAANIVAIGVLTALSSTLPASGDGGTNRTTSIILLVLGALMLALAIQQWRSRPGPGEKAEEPAWMKAIDTFTFGRSFGMGFVLALANPKNLTLTAGAAAVIGGASLATSDAVIAIVVYLLIGTCTVYLPVIAYLVAQDRLRAPLQRLREWLMQENSTIMFILFLVLGVSMLSNGLKGF